MVKQYVKLLAPLFSHSRQEVKRGWGMLPGFLILFFLMGWNVSSGQSLLVDDFSGTVGTNLTANGWVAHSGAGTGPMTIASPGLSYSGYAGSGVGNATSASGNSEDVNKAFTSTTSGSVYCAFMVNTAVSVNTTDYSLHLCQTSGSGAAGFFGRFFIQKDASNNVRFGVSKSTEAAVNTPYSYALNTTYLIVIKYTFNSGATNDGVFLYVNPTPGGTEPSPDLTTVTTGTDATALAGIAIRQFNATTLARFDGIRVGTTWASVTPSGISISSTGTPASLSTTYGTASSNTNFSVSATGLTASTGITITPPVGFEVATTSDFSTTIGTNASALNVGAAGTVSSTTIYLRLAANATAGNKTGNIVLSSTGATSVNVATNATNTVNAKALTISGLSVQDKTFDNSTTATLVGTPSLVGVESVGTAVTLGGTPVANFDTVAVGNNKPVTVSGYTISGADSGNYALTQPSLTGNILSSGLQDQIITFGALSAVTYGVAPFALTATSDSGLTVSYSSSNTDIATISGSNITIVGAGSVTITASQAGNASYNPATPVQQSLVVNQKELTVSGATASNKIYDADTTTAITGGSLVGVINSDDVSFSGTGNFDDFNVGTGKPVTGNLTLSGTKQGNYFLTQPSLTADITAKELTITGISIANKEYDTNDSATILGTATLFGVEFADAFSITLDGSPVANFNTASVGNNKPVTVSGYSFSGSSNYYLTQPTGLTANITLRTISIVGLTADNKEYDRTLGATLSGTASLSGIIPGDEPNVSLSGSPSANFLTAAAGNGKTVSVTGYSLSGTALANYTLGALNLTANITKKDVTVSGASVADKAYDGTTTATLSGTLSGVISPDDVTLNPIAAFADANVGTNKPVTSTSSITGGDSANYNLVQPIGLTASITASPCTGGTSGLVTWNFGITAALTAAPTSNTTTGVSISNVANANNLGGSATLLSTTSPSSTYPGFSAAGNAGAAAISGALNTASSTYFEFTVTPTNGNNVSLTGISFGSRSTGTGPVGYALRSSLDNYAANINTAAGTLVANSNWALISPTITATQVSSSPVVFRIYGFGGTATAPNTVTWRIDDLKLNLAVALNPALSSATTASACSGVNFSYTPTTSFTSSTITWTRAAVAGISNAAVTTPQTGDVNEVLVNTTNAPVAVVYSFKVTGTTCYATQDITVTVNPSPVVTASNVSGCSGSSIALVGSPAGGTFSVANPYVGTTSTTYTYSYTDGNGCPATSAPANITITAQPQWYLDADNDGYYTGTAIASCTSPGAGYTTSVLGGGDCNDASASIYPGATEICYNNILENCSGTLSQGCAAVVVNMTPSYNNTTLVSLATAVPAVVYSYGGYTNLKYRFSITNVTSGAAAVEVTQTSRYITIPASLHSYNAQYTIKVSAVINDEVVPYAGNTITLNSPSVQLVTLNGATCGATLATLASTITANAGLNATGYTFRIRLNDSNPSPTYYTSQSATRFVSANSFAGFPLQYSTSYKVAVQYTFNDPVTNLPVDSGYGAECTVNTPSIPLTGLASPTCGSTVAALNANISASAASYATSYQFRIRLFADNGPTPTYYYSVPNASRFSSLTAFQGISFAYSTAYSISVQYSVLNGATTVWSGYGAECKVTTPFFPTTSLVPSQCGLLTPTSLTQQLNITPYPGFPNYKVKLDEVSGEDIVNSEEIIVTYSYFRLNQFSIAQAGKNYNVSVAIKLNGVFGDYSTACDLFTAPLGKTITAVSFKATAYPNPFANNFMLDVKTTSQSAVNLKVYDMVGRLIEQRNVTVSDMGTTTIGNQYPTGVYNVVVSQEDSIQTVRVVKR